MARMWTLSVSIAAILTAVSSVIVRVQAERRRSVRRLAWNDEHWPGMSAAMREERYRRALPPTWEMSDAQLANEIGPLRARRWRKDQRAAGAAVISR